MYAEHKDNKRHKRIICDTRSIVLWMGGKRALERRTTEKRSEETKRRKVVINFRFVFCYIYIILMLSITWKKITSSI